MDAMGMERRELTPIGYKTAIRFIILIGVVSLFGDMTYEGARSVTGPYLGFLGASATIVGIVAGLGELLGYGVRLLSGWLGDRTQRYWAVMIVGYALNLFAVPLLALTSRWELAAALIVVERMGRGIRAPVRDSMLSHAAGHTGLGWGFGLHEAMDQSGAVVGPLLVSVVLYLQYGYAAAFAMLVVPAVLSMAFVFTAKAFFPRPRDFDLSPPALRAQGLPRFYWIYMTAVALIGAGYVDFALIGYHFGHAAIVTPPTIPILFAFAMASDAAASLLLGYLFDRLGVIVLVVGASLAALASPFVFLGGEAAAFLGMILWGVGMGINESVMRAVVAGMTAPDQRATAFGILNAVFGAAWFLGSVALGILYDQSVTAVAVVSLTLQLLAVPFLLLIVNSAPRRRSLGQETPGSAN
jgi:predicted MFS family arabinose efflux permease